VGQFLSHPLEGSYLSADLPEDPVVAIVKFRDDVGPVVPQNPAVHFQVTIDRNKVSPSSQFIRLGEHQGDEILGWQRREYLQVCEVLGAKAGDQVIPIPLEKAA
jgi:hypothetical protein